MYQDGRYTPWPFDQIIDTVAEMINLLNQANIPAVRVGLQAEDTLTNRDVVAGAYHPALGEYVKSRIFRKNMQTLIHPIENETITFAVAPKYLSQAIGQHKENVKYFSKLTGQKVIIIQDSSIKDNKVERR